MNCVNFFKIRPYAYAISVQIIWLGHVLFKSFLFKFCYCISLFHDRQLQIARTEVVWTCYSIINWAVNQNNWRTCGIIVAVFTLDRTPSCDLHSQNCTPSLKYDRSCATHFFHILFNSLISSNRPAKIIKNLEKYNKMRKFVLFEIE